MSTAASWTDACLDPVRDVRALLAFRVAGLRGRSRRWALVGTGLILVLTVVSGWLPGYLPEGAGRRGDVMSLLPSVLVGVLVVAVVTATASGGGRELVPRDEGSPFPIGPAADHLGALLLAPLNIAWLLQAWSLLGAVAYVVGPRPGLVLGQVVVLLWLATATAAAQVVGWGLEWLRRGPQGVLLVRLLGVAAALAGAALLTSGSLVAALQRSPTVEVVIAALQAPLGPSARTVLTTIVLLVLLAGAVVAGAAVAEAVARRPAREELRRESAAYPARRPPGSDLLALVRVDRVGIWRSVPLRRGMTVLAVMPGLVAVAGGLGWEMLTILPGLVASGGALLFGVNSWCLDGRGALWRDSLPLDARWAFLSRVVVLVEVLLVATVGTVVLASLRAGRPDAAQLAAVGSATVVVVVQVVSASLRWSVRRPFAVDLRSARATPAPPLVMVGYSARLALSTTLVGIGFSVLARLPWEWSVLVALPMVLFSAARLVHTAEAWAVPTTRAAVVATVSG